MPPASTNGRKELVAANVFGVRIPGMELGYFIECRGLAVEVEVQEYPEGGNNEFVHQLPGRLIYPKLELARGLTTEDNLLKWFMQTRVKAERKEVIIDIFNRYGEVHRSFTFDEAYPVKWTGPTIAVAGAATATEELTIAHAGLKMA
jgi:phage tail-like protein